MVLRLLRILYIKSKLEEYLRLKDIAGLKYRGIGEYRIIRQCRRVGIIECDTVDNHRRVKTVSQGAYLNVSSSASPPKAAKPTRVSREERVEGNISQVLICQEHAVRLTASRVCPDLGFASLPILPQRLEN